MRALGLTTDESIAIFAGWEKAGVNTEIAFSGMKKAISNWSSDGKDARVEFKKTLDEIAACPDIASATTKDVPASGPQGISPSCWGAQLRRQRDWELSRLLRPRP
jgi:phage-related minor tail protein